jgi:hypothetical protein
LVFRGSVLCIVDEKICATDEFGVPQILPGDVPSTVGQAPRMGFMIAAINDDRAIRLEPESECQRRMV